jgi:hypothetical protein
LIGQHVHQLKELGTIPVYCFRHLLNKQRPALRTRGLPGFCERNIYFI